MSSFFLIPPVVCNCPYIFKCCTKRFSITHFDYCPVKWFTVQDNTKKHNIHCSSLNPYKQKYNGLTFIFYYKTFYGFLKYLGDYN